MELIRRYLARLTAKLIEAVSDPNHITPAELQAFGWVRIWLLVQFGYIVRVCQLRCPVDGEAMVSAPTADQLPDQIQCFRCAPADWAMTGEGRYRRNEVDEGVYGVVR